MKTAVILIALALVGCQTTTKPDGTKRTTLHPASKVALTPVTVVGGAVIGVGTGVVATVAFPTQATHHLWTDKAFWVEPGPPIKDEDSE